MPNFDIVRAWKDEDYRASLSQEQLDLLPENPAGLIELNDEDMSSLSGGCTTCGGSTGFTHTCFGCKRSVEDVSIV